MRRKFLVLSVHRDYVNPMSRLMLSLVEELGTPVFFGPGLCSVEELERGPEAFAKKHEIDWVICDGPVYEWEVFVKRPHVFSMSRITFPVDLYRAHVESMKRFFLDSQYPKLVFGNTDPHAFTQSTIDTFVQKRVHMIFWGQELMVDDPDKLPNTYGKVFQANNAYSKFTRQHPERVISTPFFIAEHEMCYAPLDHRSIEISVPGTAYDERKMAIRVLGELARPGYWRQTCFRGLFAAISKFRKGSLNRLQVALIRLGFTALLEDSRRAFVSGSYLQFPVRKYFEIPAAGAVMYCMPCTGMEDLGFVDRQNCILVEDVKRLRELVDEDVSMRELQEIANRGRDLIRTHHSLRERAKQIMQCLEAIENETYAGSRWRKGEFVIEKRVRDDQASAP